MSKSQELPKTNKISKLSFLNSEENQPFETSKKAAGFWNQFDKCAIYRDPLKSCEKAAFLEKKYSITVSVKRPTHKPRRRHLNDSKKSFENVLLFSIQVRKKGHQKAAEKANKCFQDLSKKCHFQRAFEGQSSILSCWFACSMWDFALFYSRQESPYKGLFQGCSSRSIIWLENSTRDALLRQKCTFWSNQGGDLR